MSRQASVLDGIRVIELAEWAFVPGAAAILADLGAEVLKIEHPTQGDPYRALKTFGADNSTDGLALRAAQANRGKRSVGLDLKSAGGAEALDRLLTGADVFMTSLRMPALDA